MPNNLLKPPVSWKMSEFALKDAMVAMDFRANEEVNRISSGESINLVHEQAVRDYSQFEQLIHGAFRFLDAIGHETKGCAIDVGSGTGVGAGILSKLERINQIYALEFSENFVHHIMPVVFDHFSCDKSKIQRVVGDFNHLEVEDESIDIILDIDSFHHSENLDVTLKECARALKPGGTIIAIDRAWPDHYTHEQFEEMLNKELNQNLRRKYNIPENQSFTRRDFGEHEYTIKQWEDHFKKHDFEVNVFRQVHPPGLNSLFLRLPTFEFSVQLASFFSKLGSRRHNIYGFHTTRTLFVSIKK